ncbi:MAG: D-alanyl-D-alanine carboxypeptidase [Defluviitaleaceae bacterium]|nr:D-alanyl-D-alanine carboxypeptidase [Defluviitaleaceae bacterium]
MKIKNRIIKLTAICLILTAIVPGAAHAQENKGLALTIDAKSAVIMEMSSGEIIFEQNGDERRAPASVTKVMTMLLIYEALAQNRISWDDIVTTSEHAASMGGSQVYLEPGEQQTVRDLVKSVVIASANDGAVALAEFISGSEESFVDLMNKKAQALGMENTSFRNACGLDADGHFTTARDIAIMSRELMVKYPEVAEYATTWMDNIIHKTHRGEEEFGLTNTNKLVKWYNGTTGLKTGSTGQAMYCLSATAIRGDMELIAVVLGAPNPTTRFQEAMKMLDYGFANYKVVKGELPGTVVGTIHVSKGKEAEVAVVVQDLISNVTEKGSNVELESQIFINETVQAPVEAGFAVGEIVYTYEGQEIGRSPLVTEEAMERAGFVDMLGRVADIWFK